MALDFSEFFKKYEAVVAEVDAVFQKFEHDADMGELVKCGKGCSDCCNALFDITMVEAIYLNHKFNQAYSGMERSRIMERADKADRQIHKLKRKVFKASRDGAGAREVLEEVSRARVRCPLLSDDDLCSLYEHRPITCRLYGVPTSIGGKAHTCSLTGFKPGEKYPTVNMDIILDKLLALSEELSKSIGSRFKGLGEMLVPVSMALITDFNEGYLGVSEKKAEPKAEKKPAPKPAAPVSDACGSCSQDKSACASCKENTVVLGGYVKGEEE
ncbi:YkgJ family cysteine cluster protein [Pseudodesulfovibrio tunisiensis]|uniref:YkgJ family cysteine cluster protein n=1 Tax=Pseudodesulfovibrio tunisiensis TaxID=463192 RepID=UPI001FB1B7C7|nr:YkgJ family cysteine cluster protein [Pseudodesulfovibrio tunisiensis]